MCVPATDGEAAGYTSRDSRMDLQFVIGRYDRELDRKDQLTSAVNFPVTILILLGSALVTMTQGMPFNGGAIMAGFIVALLFTMMFIAASLYNLGYAYMGEKYEYLAKLDDIADAESELADEEFDEALRESIIEATDANTELNQTRQAFLGYGNRFMLLAVVFAAVTGVFYVFGQAAQN
jgi:ABC-type transport system involved in cytochrome bd biosynthesis fused ATPase/permease subunit